MTHHLSHSRTARGLLAATAIAASLCIAPAHAAPGAHGPNGEHLDAPGGAHQHNTGASVPRMEAASETFELVGRLDGDELSVLVDRFDTNEPVLGAKLEVESNGIKAAGTFHADHGDYAFTDERLLKALAQPGKHPLVFTIFAGNDSDLLEGTLDVTAVQAAHDHPHVSARVWVAGALTTLTMVAGAFWIRRRSNKTKAGRSVGTAGS
jgi:hypothetical protein